MTAIAGLRTELKTNCVVNLKDELELKIVVRSEQGARILSAMMRAYEGSATVCAEGVLRVWNPR